MTLPYVGADGELKLMGNFPGLLGPKGETGPKGPMGNSRKMTRAELTYANVTFSVVVETSTLEMIEDEKCLNIGDLDLIEVVNKDDWSTIREEWCKEWQMIKARRAFAMGDMEDDSF